MEKSQKPNTSPLSFLDKNQKMELINSFLVHQKRKLFMKTFSVSFALIVATGYTSQQILNGLLAQSNNAESGNDRADNHIYPKSSLEREMQKKRWVLYAQKIADETQDPIAMRVVNFLQSTVYSSNMSPNKQQKLQFSTENKKYSSQTLPFVSIPKQRLHEDGSLLISTDQVLHYDEVLNALIVLDTSDSNGKIKGIRMLTEGYYAFLHLQSSSSAQVSSVEFEFYLMEKIFGKSYQKIAQDVSKGFVFKKSIEKGRDAIEINYSGSPYIDDSMSSFFSTNMTKELMREMTSRMLCHGGVIAADKQISGKNNLFAKKLALQIIAKNY